MCILYTEELKYRRVKNDRNFFSINGGILLNRIMEVWHFLKIPSKIISLSTAGKVVTIQASTSTIPIYQMNSFKIPVAIIDKISKLQRDFFWGKDKEGSKDVYLKGWTDMCIPKSLGRLGFLNLNLFNSAMLAKVSWRLLHEPKTLCSQVFKHKYFIETISSTKVISVMNLLHGFGKTFSKRHTL